MPPQTGTFDDEGLLKIGESSTPDVLTSSTPWCERPLAGLIQLGL